MGDGEREGRKKGVIWENREWRRKDGVGRGWRRKRERWGRIRRNREERGGEE